LPMASQCRGRARYYGLQAKSGRRRVRSTWFDPQRPIVRSSSRLTSEQLLQTQEQDTVFEAAIRKNKPQSRKMKSGDKPPMGDIDPVNRRRFCNRGQSSLTADTQSPIVQKNFDISRVNPR